MAHLNTHTHNQICCIQEEQSLAQIRQQYDKNLALLDRLLQGITYDLNTIQSAGPNERTLVHVLMVDLPARCSAFDRHYS